MRLQRLDALLLTPALVIGLATAAEMIVPAAWIDFILFMTAPLSGLPILAYLWLGRRCVCPGICPDARGSPGWRTSEETDIIASNYRPRFGSTVVHSSANVGRGEA
jgi:hypothetical protein